MKKSNKKIGEFNIATTTKVHVFKFPLAKKLNPTLHKMIIQKAINKDKGALMTSWGCHYISQFKSIADYAVKMLQSLERDPYTPVLLTKEEKKDAPILLYNLWGQYYKKDQFQESHNHIPHHWAFVYYVNTPPGSSPIIFSQSNEKFFPKEGQLILFPGFLWHHVPPNQCKERTVVAGNLLYMKLK